MRNRFISFVVAFALMFGAVVPAFAAIKIASDYNENLALAELLGGDAKILICTADGFKYVSIADIQSGKEQPKKQHCKLCFASVVHEKFVVANAAFPEFELQEIELKTLAIANEDNVRSSLIRGRHSRAPPLVS